MLARHTERLTSLARADPHLRLLVLYGSRARGDARVDSDWDFGYLADAGFDGEAWLVDLVRELETEHVDLVNLDRASGQLRYRAAADARVLYERSPRTFSRFWFEAVSFWCDMQDVIRAEYEAHLKKLSA